MSLSTVAWQSETTRRLATRRLQQTELISPHCLLPVHAAVLVYDVGHDILALLDFVAHLRHLAALGRTGEPCHQGEQQKGSHFATKEVPCA